jgi:hypothetical protein
VVERYKLTEGGNISIHVEDPGAFTTPWNAKQRFQRIDRVWEEDICPRTSQFPALRSGAAATSGQAGFLAHRHTVNRCLLTRVGFE